MITYDIFIPFCSFCIKTKDEHGTKVFINVCTSTTIPLPPTWPTKQPLSVELKTYLTSGELLPEAAQHAQQALAFPMHLSTPREDLDHQGYACTVVDYVINPQALHATVEFRPLKLFIIQLALGEVERKLQTQLDPQFKLPKMRFKGEIAPLSLPENSLLSSGTLNTHLPGSNRAKDKPEIELILPGQTPSSAPPSSVGIKKKEPVVPLVQELPDSNTSSPIHIGTTKSNTKSTFAFPSTKGASTAAGAALPATKIIPKQQLEQNQQEQPHAGGAIMLRHAVKYEGHPAQGAIITVLIPKAVLLEQGLAENPTRISIQIRLDCVEISIPGCASVVIQLPLAIRTEQGGSGAAPKGPSAVLEKGEGKLEVRLPFASFKEISWRTES